VAVFPCFGTRRPGRFSPVACRATSASSDATCKSTLNLEANAPLEIKDPGRPRIFNLVPGFEAVPVFTEIPPEATLSCRIRVILNG